MKIVYKNAWLHFYPKGNGKAKPGHCLHHIDVTLKKRDPDRYNEWRISDLVMMTRIKHSSLHKKFSTQCHKDGLNPSARKVLCINTGEIFECMKHAAEKYSIYVSNICHCCKGALNSTGKLPDGTKLRWKYVD